MGWHWVKDAKNMKSLRVGTRVWWWYPPLLDVRSDLCLGLGASVPADYVMDSLRSFLVGAATPQAWVCHLAHIPLGWRNLSLQVSLLLFGTSSGLVPFTGLLYGVSCEDLWLTTINNYFTVVLQGMKKWDHGLSIFWKNFLAQLVFFSHDTPNLVFSSRSNWSFCCF